MKRPSAMGWTRLSPELAAKLWDEALSTLSGRCVFQSLRWGLYKKDLGWEPQYWIACDGSSADGASQSALGKSERIGGANPQPFASPQAEERENATNLIATTLGKSARPAAMAQVLIKRVGGVAAVGWCRGGPAGAIELWNDEFRRAVARATGAPLLYLRISPEAPISAGLETAMSSLGWRRPSVPLSTGKTILLNLDRPEKELSENLSRNWSHNLRRSQSRGLKIVPWTSPTVDEMASVYGSMQEYKRLGEQHSREDLKALFDHLGSDILCLRCEDAQGRLLAFRACAAQGGKAWDLLAASSPEGRKCYASYALLWNLLLECRKLGVKRYDLSGVDPEKAKGVYDFKKGTGGSEAELLGEWDWASPGWLRLPANRLIRARLRA